MKRSIPPTRRAVLSPLVIALCAFSPALFCQEPPAPQRIWPLEPGSAWVWVEPRADLAAAEVDAVLGRLISEQTAYIDARFPVSIFFARKARLVEGKAKRRRGYGGQPEKADDLRFEAEWQNGYLNQYRGRGYTHIPLDGVRGVELRFLQRPTAAFAKAPADRHWNVNVLADRMVSFFFGLEDTARAFVSALASALAQRGLGLGFSRSGLMWDNITAAQAADMGRPPGAGVLVTQVALGGPADRAGVRPLDVVQEVNGEKVKNYSHLALTLDGLAPGAKAALGLLRRLKPPGAVPEPCPWETLRVEMEVR